jgi:hypothetical protein
MMSASVLRWSCPSQQEDIAIDDRVCANLNVCREIAVIPASKKRVSFRLQLMRVRSGRGTVVKNRL